jgi:uncharacterized membrane protein YoaT (DUF817 family)
MPSEVAIHSSRLNTVGRDFLTFTWLQVLSSIFGISVFLILAFTKAWSPFSRYDFVLLLCLAVQWIMVKSKLETWDEVKVISLFHVIGLALEIWKVHHGSWSYPDRGFLRIGGVPIYSGFMYAAVASYITQAWRRFDLSMRPLPPGWLAIGLASAIYLNFFLNAYLPDARWWLMGLVMAIYTWTRCSFTVNERRYWLPLSVAFILIAIFIWVGENIGTILGAWQYPNQKFNWSMVHESKISSWFLLVIISYITVAWLKDVKAIKRSV